MKLTKSELNTISNQYNLGKIISIKLMRKGVVNYNFDAKTDRGEVIIRIMGYKLDEHNKKKKELEFKILNFLKENNFPYEIPVPIKNKSNNYLSRINEKNIWVYKKIIGDRVKKLNKEQIKEIAKALATYHKFIYKFKDYSNINRDETWILNKFSEMRKVESNNKINKLVLDKIDFIEKSYLEIKKDFNENIIVNHSDFHKHNVLFQGNKVVAILDFDNLKIAPRAKDISYAIRAISIKNSKLNNRTMNLFIKEYEKIWPLSKKEKQMIIPYMIIDRCIVFWWFYEGMKKKKHKKYEYMLDSVNIIKNLQKQLH